MELRPGLQVADSALATFARRYGIARLALFGSATSAAFDSSEREAAEWLARFEAEPNGIDRDLVDTLAGSGCLPLGLARRALTGGS